MAKKTGRTPADIKAEVRRLQEEAAKAEKEIIIEVGQLAQKHYKKDGFADMGEFKREAKELLDQIDGGNKS